MVTPFALNELVNSGLLAPVSDGMYPVWMVPPASDRVPNPPYGYVVSFVWLHERGFTASVSRFMRGLCYHYGVDLHNFAPNTISQAATYVAICEGFLGILANWYLWVHLFRAELHTLATGEVRTRRVVGAGGLALALQGTCKEMYLLCTMTSNNVDWEKDWFYLHNDGAGLPPYTGKVLVVKIDAWHYGVSTPAWQRRLESVTTILRRLVDAGLGTTLIIANFHHRRVAPLKERELYIFEMSDANNPGSLARSRLLQERFPKEYTATRARRAISLKSVPHSDDDLWSFVMLPNGQLVRMVFLFLSTPCAVFFACPDDLYPQLVVVSAARSDPPTPRARAAGRAAQRQEQERAARAKEKKLKRRERLE
jgi:hypothetical protein